MNRYICYLIFDPFDLRPCYVGRGRKNRHTIHRNFARGDLPASAHGNTALINRLREGLRAGREAPTVILFDNLTSDQSIEFEAAWIMALGRADLGTGPLLNLNNGTRFDEPLIPSWKTRPLPDAQINASLRKRDPLKVSRLRPRVMRG
jgi:hypothetical protein